MTRRIKKPARKTPKNGKCQICGSIETKRTLVRSDCETYTCDGCKCVWVLLRWPEEEGRPASIQRLFFWGDEQ